MLQKKWIDFAADANINMYYKYEPVDDRILQTNDADALAHMMEHMSEHMRLHTEQTPYLTFPLLEELSFLKHGFSTRFGGVSEGEFSAMNLYYKNDEKERVLENYRRFCAGVGILPEQLVLTSQQHTDHIRAVTKDDYGKGYCRERDYTAVDALITNEAGVALTVFGADCVPLFFAEKHGKAIGVAHAGWKGTIADIAGKTVQALQNEYQIEAANLYVGIGPSICGKCFEIDEALAEKFKQELPAEVVEEALFTVQETDGLHPHLDLWKVNYNLLLRAGVPKEQIVAGNVCTCHDPMNRYLFSHRATQGRRGGMAGVLMLRNGD